MKLNLPNSKARYIVGVSGGPDSVALLKAMTEAGCHCVVAHCNFALRGEESDGDERFVCRLCDEMGVECITVRFETEIYAKEKGVSIEMAARELRYEWFERMRVEHECDYIAVAHNLNDQVETFFLNLSRGTGLKGLCGMEWMNGRVVRPLLGISRQEIMEYVGEEYRIDRTNDEIKYKRNRIRHRILPEMEEMNPSFLRTMEKTMENLKSAQALLEETRGSRPSRPSRSSRESRQEQLYLELQGLGFNREQICQIARTEENGGSGQRFVSGKAEVVINRGRAVVYHCGEESVKSLGDARQCVSTKPTAQLSIVNCQLSIEENPTTLNLRVGEANAQISKSKVRGELVLRHWEKGERFQPSGMGGKSKKISDFLTSLKMDIVEKENQLVVVDKTENDERIVWVVGKRVDERYLV